MYFLIQAAAAVLCIYLFEKRAERVGLFKQTALYLGMGILFFGWLGGRLMHIIYEEPTYYWQDWHRIFDFSAGGFVFFGGALAGWAVLEIYVRRFSADIRNQWRDCLVVPISLGYAIGRVGCSFAGCCFGRFYSVGSFDFQFPFSLTATACEGVLLFTLLKIEKKSLPAGYLAWFWLFFHSLTRFVLEFSREDFRGPSFVFSISQWIAIGLACVAWMQLRRISKRK